MSQKKQQQQIAAEKKGRILPLISLIAFEEKYNTKNEAVFIEKLEALFERAAGATKDTTEINVELEEDSLTLQATASAEGGARKIQINLNGKNIASAQFNVRNTTELQKSRILKDTAEKIDQLIRALEKEHCAPKTA